MNQKIKQGSLLHFRRWGNKSYSAFCSMHKMVKVCVLSTASLASLGLPSAVAQADLGISKEVTLDEVEVNAEASDVMMDSELTRIIAVVTKSEIEQSPALSLPQLLETLPGIDVRQRGAHDTQADLSLRAGSFDQVLILLNGINISDPQTGHNNLNIPISLSSIERIEVLEGAGLRYNSEGAFAGAINIVTQIAEKNSASVEFSRGSYNYKNFGAHIALKHKRLSHTLDYSSASSDGYQENTDFENKRIYYRSIFDNKKLETDFQFGYVDNGFGANSFYSASYPNQYEQLNSMISSFRLTTGEKIQSSPKVYYKRSFDRFELFRDGKDAASWYTGHNYHQTDVSGLGSDFNFSSDFGKTNLGFDLRHERIRSNQLGEAVDSIKHPKEDGIYYTHEKKRTNYNTYLNHTYYWNNAIIGANMLVNYNGISEEVKPYFGIDAAYQFSNSISIKASANQSFRMPTFTELYYNGATNVGNSSLQQEEATTYDMAFEYKTDLLSFHAAGYHRRGKDIIDWVKKETTDEKWSTMNYSEINTSGIEASLRFSPMKLNDSWSWFENVNTSLSYNKSTIANQEYISYYALDYLKFKWTISGDFTIYKKLKTSIMFQYQERENVTNSDTQYQPFWLCDASLRWDGKFAQPYIKASNLFDTIYYDFSSLPQAGRWITAGIKFKI